MILLRIKFMCLRIYITFYLIFAHLTSSNRQLNNTNIILSASVKLPPEKFVTAEDKKNSKEEALSEPKKFILNSADELYAELRDKNFNAVGIIVSRKAKTITAEYDVCSTFRFLGIVL